MWGTWISKVNHSFAIITTADLVAVHFLGRDQHALAQHFGGLSGDEVDKFAGIELTDDPTPVPLLADCQTRLIGRRIAVYDGPTDHSCVVIDPTSITIASDFEPLRITAVGDITPGHPLHS